MSNTWTFKFTPEDVEIIRIALTHCATRTEEINRKYSDSEIKLAANTSSLQFSRVLDDINNITG